MRELAETLPDTAGVIVRSITELDSLYAQYRQGDKSIYGRGCAERRACGRVLECLKALNGTLTEGPLKGDIASYFANDALFVCLGGVNAHKGLRETLLSLGVTEVMEAMDMDQFTNPQVRQAITTLRREVQSIPGIRYYQCTWNPRFKGVDDYLLDWTKRRTA